MAKKNWLSSLTRLFHHSKFGKGDEKKHRSILSRKFKVKKFPLPHLQKSDVENENEIQRSIYDTSTLAEMVTVAAQAPKIISTATVRIQAAFRGYLARKALKALKGLVKLQALIRGQVVRRQTIRTLKYLQSISNIQSDIAAKKLQNLETCPRIEKLSDETSKTVEYCNERRWDDCLFTNEKTYAMFQRRKDTLFRKERIREYSLVRRKSTEQEQSKVQEKWKHWLDHWVDRQEGNGMECQNKDLHSMPTLMLERDNLILKSQQKHHGINAIVSLNRRSYTHLRNHSDGGHVSLQGLVTTPSYMETTESAKAKSRSMISWKVRTKSLDSFSEGNSPSQSKVSLFVRDLKSNSKTEGHSNRSVSLKTVTGPVRSSRLLNVSF